jgi:aspartate kinase
MIVQKYGGVTVESPEKIKATALRIRSDLEKSKKILVVVSAMGSTTNNLISLARSVSERPNLRELDMLLTTGERISASLMAMALLDLGVKATSLTGSQAGILTTENHSNAFIIDIRPHRILSLLKVYDVIVIAGFQGVSENTKNITTLGRGGSDTTAIALASRLEAHACYILKEVPSILSVDPKISSEAIELPKLSFKQASQITFWGAKVLHHRSTKIAEKFKIPVYVGPANNQSAMGTWITEELPKMFETPSFFAITSFSQILYLQSFQNKSVAEMLPNLYQKLKSLQIMDVQVLSSSVQNKKVDVFLTGPDEALQLILSHFKKQTDWLIVNDQLCSITMHCSPTLSHDLQSQFLAEIESLNLDIIQMLINPDSITLIMPKDKNNLAINHLHDSLIVPSLNT